MTLTFVGKYQLLQQLAVGGMAELYLAQFTDLTGAQRQVVLKRVARRYANDPAFRQMFLDEARIAAMLNHPNIVQMYDVGEADGQCFLVMEYLQGYDLRAVLAKSMAERGEPIPPALAAQIAIRICSALHFAHEAKASNGTPLQIVHRDVSPSNVMVTMDGHVKLIDFGIARAANRSSLTEPGLLKGKARYMSPEQLRGDGVDRRTDIFTLGITLWECTVGQHLFDADNDAQIFNLIHRGQIRSPSDVIADYPPALESIVLQALSLTADARFATAQSMQRALEDTARAAQWWGGELELAAYVTELFSPPQPIVKKTLLFGQNQPALNDVLPARKKTVFSGSGSLTAVESNLPAKAGLQAAGASAPAVNVRDDKFVEINSAGKAAVIHRASVAEDEVAAPTLMAVEKLEDKEPVGLTRQRTGDWSTQPNADVPLRRPGTHPYFKADQDGFSAMGGLYGTADNHVALITQSKRKKLIWFFSAVFLTSVFVLGGIAIVRSKKTAPPVTPATVAAVQSLKLNVPVASKVIASPRVELTTEPLGARIYAAHSGIEMGTTPISIDLSKVPDHKIEIHHPGYQMLHLTLSPKQSTQHVTLSKIEPSKKTSQRKARGKKHRAGLKDPF